MAPRVTLQVTDLAETAVRASGGPTTHEAA